MGNGIPAPNVNTWDGSKQAAFPITPGLTLDPGTGGLYNSAVPYQDTPVIYHSRFEVPRAPAIVTQGSLLGALEAPIITGY